MCAQSESVWSVKDAFLSNRIANHKNEENLFKLILSTAELIIGSKKKKKTEEEKSVRKHLAQNWAEALVNGFLENKQETLSQHHYLHSILLLLSLFDNIIYFSYHWKCSRAFRDDDDIVPYIPRITRTMLRLRMHIL